MKFMGTSAGNQERICGQCKKFGPRRCELEQPKSECVLLDAESSHEFIGTRIVVYKKYEVFKVF